MNYNHIFGDDKSYCLNQIRAAARLSQLLKNYDVRLKECKTALPAGVPKKLGQEATKEVIGLV